MESFLSEHLKSNFAINKRLQLIIKHGSHYLTVDISCAEHKRCLLLDAANDKRMMSVYGKLKQFAFDRLFVASGKRDELGKVHNLQQDFDSCSMFAFDHAVQLSKRDIYSDLEKLVGDNCQRRGYTTVYWEQLPIQLVWNAQSLNFFTNYLEVNKNKLTQGELKAYKKYIKKNTELDAKKKSRNVAVDRIFDSSLKQIFPWVEKLSQTEIDYIAGEDTYLMPMQRESTFVFANNNAFFKSCKIRKKVSANSPRVFESSSSLLGELVRYQTLLQS
ncbi:hypothetical protein [Candidatus Rickettsiella viridis]|uniref:hypothetical protein n=1 Tax=Candidatus Rickettsiella viridis TaxID=676208 RepID=UPI0011AE506B|nr:hypothetical protein [Candidatus Rickettsiella viridis]